MSLNSRLVVPQQASETQCLVAGTKVLAIRGGQLIAVAVETVWHGELLIDEQGRVTRVEARPEVRRGPTCHVSGSTGSATPQAYSVSAGHTLTLRCYRPYKIDYWNDVSSSWALKYATGSLNGTVERVARFSIARDGSLLEHRAVEYEVAPTSTAYWFTGDYALVDFDPGRNLWRWMAVWRVPGDNRRYFKFSESPAAELHPQTGNYFNQDAGLAVRKVSKFCGRPWGRRPGPGDWLCTLPVLRHMCDHTPEQLREGHHHYADVIIPLTPDSYTWQWSESLGREFPLFFVDNERVYPASFVVQHKNHVKAFFDMSPTAGPYHAYHCNNFPNNLPGAPVIAGRRLRVRSQTIWWPEGLLQAYLDWRMVHDNTRTCRVIQRINVLLPGDNLAASAQDKIVLWWERQAHVVRYGELIDVQLEDYSATGQQHILRKNFGGARGSLVGDLQAYIPTCVLGAALEAALRLLGGTWFVGMYHGDGTYADLTPRIAIGLHETAITDKMVGIFVGQGVKPALTISQHTGCTIDRQWVGDRFKVKETLRGNVLIVAVSEPGVRGNRVLDALCLLQAAGVAGHKRIHPCIKYGAKPLRDGVIAGLVDSDGCRPKRVLYTTRDDGCITAVEEDILPGQLEEQEPRFQEVGVEDPPCDIARHWEFIQAEPNAPLNEDTRDVAKSLGLINGSLPDRWELDELGSRKIRTYFTGPGCADVSQYVALPHKRISERRFRPHHHQMRPEISVINRPHQGVYYSLRVSGPTDRILLDDWTITHV